MRNQSPREEKWNTWSHALGAVLGVPGLFVLLAMNNQHSPWSYASIILYSCSMILLFSSSAIYHYVTSEKSKLLWRKMDHISIYFLIAGTYTPIALISLYKDPGVTIFTIVWSMVLIGTLLKVFFTGRFQLLSVLLYLGMGWLIVLYWGKVQTALTEKAVYLMFLGGAFYSTGVIFYLLKRLRFQHVIWHFFVLAGAMAHFFMVLEVVR
ncbi:PAQR family membrane homeostasis protein TrhA [Robertkochia flava]|uniref:PAQR family membrane homeostasis protein TrhA n=1 Tax=Robertkochia flava TaxID=3447986 RepID=UPI001CC942EF|nr:hemolysin III family protein [Robertkochia marina]